MNTSDYKSFTYLENGDVLFSPYKTIKSNKILDKGSYKMDNSGYPNYNVILKSDSDFETTKSYTFKNKEKIDALFKAFFNKETRCKIEDLGFCHKVGILLHGIEGTGKTTIMKYYCSKAITEEDALVFHILCNDENISYCWDFIQDIRKIQDNPIILVFDEFDQQMRCNEAFLKTAIDGNMSVSNCIFFASTNYLDKIPNAMKDRASRFKYSIEIGGIENVEEVEIIVKNILSDILSDKEIQDIAKNLQNKTLDDIKQYCFDKLMYIDPYKQERPKIGF